MGEKSKPTRGGGGTGRHWRTPKPATLLQGGRHPEPRLAGSPDSSGRQLPLKFLRRGTPATPKRTGFTSLLPERQMDTQAWRVGEGSRSLIPVPGCFFDQSGIDQSGISPKRCGALGKSHPIPHFTSLREKILIHGRAFMVYKMTSWSSLVALWVKDLA